MRASFMAPSADKYAQAAIRTIGYARHTTGYFPHALMQVFINTLHAIVPDFSNNMILRNMEKIREKALRRLKSK